MVWKSTQYLEDVAQTHTPTEVLLYVSHIATRNRKFIAQLSRCRCVGPPYDYVVMTWI